MAGGEQGFIYCNNLIEFCNYDVSQMCNVRYTEYKTTQLWQWGTAGGFRQITDTRGDI